MQVSFFSTSIHFTFMYLCIKTSVVYIFINIFRHMVSYCTSGCLQLEAVFFYYYMYECGDICAMCVCEGQREDNLTVVSSYLSLCRVLGSNAGHQTWQQVPSILFVSVVLEVYIS